MKKCINCKHYFTRGICGFCDANDDIREVEHPFFMGGKKCECYEKTIKQKKKKFEYPKKTKLEKGLEEMETLVKEKACVMCRKYHTNECPNSSECYSTKDKPYFE